MYHKTNGCPTWTALFIKRERKHKSDFKSHGTVISSISLLCFLKFYKRDPSKKKYYKFRRKMAKPWFNNLIFTTTSYKEKDTRINAVKHEN